MPPRRIIPIDMDMGVAMAFYNTLGTWSKAVEAGEAPLAEIQLQKLKILGHKMIQDDGFKRRLATMDTKLDVSQMLDCLCDYLGILTKAAPSRIDRYEDSARCEN